MSTKNLGAIVPRIGPNGNWWIGNKDLGVYADVGAIRDVKADLVNGKVPISQLPSYVDDVIEAYYNDVNGLFYWDDTYTTELEPETGKIYICKNSGKTFRWTGTIYQPISSFGGSYNDLTDVPLVTDSMMLIDGQLVLTDNGERICAVQITDQRVDEASTNAVSNKAMVEHVKESVRVDSETLNDVLDAILQ